MKLPPSTTNRGPWRGPSQIRRTANAKGKPAERRQGYQTLPQEGAKSANPALRDSMFGPHSQRNEPSRGIGGESDNRVAVARRAIGPSGGHVVEITEDVRLSLQDLRKRHDRRRNPQSRDECEIKGVYRTRCRSVYKGQLICFINN